MCLVHACECAYGYAHECMLCAYVCIQRLEEDIRVLLNHSPLYSPETGSLIELIAGQAVRKTQGSLYFHSL